MRKVATLIALLILIPGFSQATSLEDLLVEKGVITRQEARASGHGGANVYWKGGTRLEFPDTGFTAKINTQLQPRYEFTDNEFSGNTSSFRLRRARLQVSGNALNDEFTYRLQVGMVSSTGASGASSPSLRDAYLTWAPCNWGTIQMGQFKTSVSRQFNTSSAKLQFPDRTAASDLFQIGRAQGARANITQWDNWTVTAGLFNGESDGEGENLAGVDTNHTVVLSARTNLTGEMDAHEEGDLGRTQDLAVNVGAAFAHSDGTSDIGSGAADTETQRVSVDINVKKDGTSLHGEFFWANLDNDLVSTDAEPIGFYVQAGTFLNDKWELAARGAYTDCDDGGAFDACAGLDEITEAGVSANYYFWKHNLKAQVAFTYLEDGALTGGTDVETNRIIFQLSAYL